MSVSDRTLARMAWVVFGVVTVGYAAATVFGYANRSRPGVDPPSVAGGLFSLLFVASTYTFAVVGVLVVTRRPRNGVGWLYLAIGASWGVGLVLTAYGIYGLGTDPGSVPFARAAWVLGDAAWVAPIGLMGTYGLLLFPDGHLPSRGWRPLAWASGIVLVLSYLVLSLSSGTVRTDGIAPFPNPLAVPGLGAVASSLMPIIVLIPICIVGCAWALVRRFRRSAGIERLQLKWVTSAAAAVALVYLVTFVVSIPYAWSASASDGTPPWVAVLQGISPLSFSLIPIAAGVAILRHNLYDIDVVINKALVYGALALFITMVYVSVVVGIGELIRSRGAPNLGLSIVATAVVAFAFQPVRVRFQRFANRLVYGKRATPYEAMIGFADRVEGAVSTDEILPRMVEATAAGVNASAVRVRLYLPDGGDRSRSWSKDGEVEAYDRAVPVRYLNEEVGRIEVAKAPGDPITPQEARLLDDLAGQAGIAMRNARLAEELHARLEEISAQAEDLRSSRQRIVSARDAERRRLERDIHDGAEQQLIHIGGGLREVEPMLETDPEAALAALDRLSGEAQGTLETLRDLARGIFPPLLVDKGLVTALQAQTNRATTPGELRVADGLAGERFEPDVEAAVYFCCVEALQSAAKREGGEPVTISLSRSDGWLQFDIANAGPRFGDDGIADRVEAVGGALTTRSNGGSRTVVHGRVPVAVEQS